MNTLTIPLLAGQTPAEMQLAQKGMKAWCATRKVAAESRIAQLEAHIAEGEQHGLNMRSQKTMLRNEKKRLAGYQKVAAALSAGYYLVPNFPVDWFAIRRTERKPRREECDWSHTQFTQSMRQLEIGKGRYVDPVPFRSEYIRRDPEGKTTRIYYPVSFDEDITPPAALVNAGLMPHLIKALRAKVFDAIGLVRNTRSQGRDPMLVGAISFGGPSYSPKELTFLISWWMDFKDF